MGFQTQVNAQQAPAVAGDFASANPRAAVGEAGQEAAAGSAIGIKRQMILNFTGNGIKPGRLMHHEPAHFSRSGQRGKL